MIIEANSREDAIRIVKAAIADDRVLKFSQDSSIKLGYIQVKDLHSYFTIENNPMESRPSSRYSYVFEEDEDDIPTRPDTPSLLKKS